MDQWSCQLYVYTQKKSEKSEKSYNVIEDEHSQNAIMWHPSVLHMDY